MTSLQPPTLLRPPVSCPLEPLQRSSSSSSHSTYCTTCSGSGSGTEAASFANPNLMQGLSTPTGTDAYTLDKLLADDLLGDSGGGGGSSRQFSSGDHAPPMSAHLLDLQPSSQFAFATGTAAAGAAAAGPAAAAAAGMSGLRAPNRVGTHHAKPLSFDLSDLEAVDLQELLCMSEAELLAPFTLDDEMLHFNPCAAAAADPQRLTTVSPPRPTVIGAAEALTACCHTPPQPPPGIRAAASHSGAPVTPSDPMLDGAIASGLQQFMDLQELGVGHGIIAGATIAASSPKPSRPMRSSRKRRVASPLEADAPQQLETLIQKQEREKEQNRQHQQKSRARKKVC